MGACRGYQTAQDTAGNSSAPQLHAHRAAQLQMAPKANSGQAVGGADIAHPIRRKCGARHQRRPDGVIHW